MRTSWRAGLLAVGVGLVGLLVGFGVLTAGTGAPPRGARATASASASASASGSTRVGWGSVPLAALAPVSAALGADRRGYRMHAGNGGFHALSSQQRLRASFGPAGARISSGGSVVGMRLTGIGYGSSLTPISAVAPSAAANRVTYPHAGVSEWYSNGPLGIEQGFTIPSAPAHVGTGPLTLSLALSGNLHASLEHGGQQLDLDRAGRPALAYRDLTASDASGRTLPARLALSGGRLSIAVDARGARYPLRIDPLMQQPELTASGGVAGEVLGSAVAVSGDGSTIVAGAPGGAGDPSDPGAVYVFSEPAGGWSTGTQTAKLTVSSGAAGDNLGYSVAISNDGSTIVAGARHVTVNANLNAGAVYAFVKPGSAWAPTATPNATLTVNGGAIADNFGWSVAVSGDGSTVVAGAPDAGSFLGAGYVFTRGPTWGSETQAATLTPRFRIGDPDPATQLGWSSAISEDGSTIVLGASGNEANGFSGGQGGAYVYVRSGASWSGTPTETGRLTASDGGMHDLLGTAVATSSDGSTVIAGTESTVNPGAVYVFVKPALGGWADATENAKLTASDGANADFLGSSLAISADGSTVVAGAPNAKIAGAVNQGAVYIFDKPSTGWIGGLETAKLVATDGATSNALGHAVASSSDGTTVVAGAAAAAGGKGVAYEFGGSGSGAGPFPLNVSVGPTGGGSVSSQPAGISCPTSCNMTYASGTSVTLTATPASGYKFAAWSGDCAGTAAAVCTLSISQARTVSAIFSNRASTKLTLICGYQASAGNEICQASVTGATTAPTGQVVFQSSNGGFTSGNSCTLGSGASCQVTVLPPIADLTTPGSVGVSATYGGDTTYAPSTAATAFSTAAEIGALQSEVNNSCSVFVVNPNGGSLTSIGPTLGGTYIASMGVVAADAFGLIPPAPSSSSAADFQTDQAGDNGSQDSTCVVQSSPASAANDVSADAARATKCTGKAAKGKRSCKTVVIGRVKKTLKSGVKYTIRVPLTAAGRHYFKLQKSADKTYLKHHHGKHSKPPRLKIRVTITFIPSG
jgi:hypothetical protein